MVVLAVSSASYWHILQTLETQTYDKLEKYIQERGEKESAIFQLAEDNHLVFKQEYLSVLANAEDVTEAQFNQIYQPRADGTTRMNQALFDGVSHKDGRVSRYNSAYLGQNAPVADQAFRNRVVRAHELIDRFGMVWTTRFANVYVSLPENGIVGYWPGKNWGQEAQATLDVSNSEWVTIANQTNNPQRRSVWTGLHYDETADEWMVSCETPVDYQGKNLLTVGHDYLLNDLFERVFYDHLDGTYNFIFHQDGRLIVHPQKLGELSKASGNLHIDDLGDETLSSYYRQVVAQTRGLTSNVKVFLNDADDTFLAASRISGPGWWFVAVSPKEVYASTAREAAEFILGLGIISLVLELLMLFWVLRFKVVEPLNLFVNASEDVREGDYDKVVSGELKPLGERSDEVGLLARMFCMMAERINNSIEELKHLDVLKDEFMANTSHELRTPLNGIVGIADSMLDGATGTMSVQQRYNLSLIVTSGQRLTNLVNDILDFSKLKHKKLTLQIGPLDIHALAEVVVMLSSPMIKDSGIELVNRIEPLGPAVYGDENRLQQILYNLIGNAIKFTEQGTIAVSAEVKGEEMVITVSDTGIGIAAEKLESVFESFEQVDGSTDRLYGGTGLGLAVTKQLVELHGGRIWGESTVGEGTSLRFTLPICQDKATTGQVADLLNREVGVNRIVLGADNNDGLAAMLSPEGFAGGFNNGHVLIVDDDPVNIQVLKNHLSLQNYGITTAANGKEAIAAIESGEQFDAVLLDVMMPGMSGYEVCQHIREKYTANRLPILMVTAKTHTDDMTESFDAGANDFLTKPVSKVELRERLKTHISVVRLNNDLSQASSQLQNYAKALEQKVTQRTGQLEQRGEELEQANKQLLLANERVNQSAADMLLLSELGRELTSTLELDEVIEKVYHSLNKVLDAHIFLIGILEPENNRIHVPLIVEQNERIGAVDFALDEVGCPAVWCVQNKKELLIFEAGDSNKYFDVPLMVPEFGVGMNTIIYQPLIIGDKIVGCLSLESPEPHAYSADKIQIIRTLASYSSIAMANALGYTRLEQTHEALKNTQQQLVLQEKMASLGILTAGVAHEINNPTNFVHVGIENMEVDLTRFQQFIFDLAGDDADERVLDSLRSRFTPLYEHIATIKNGSSRIMTIVQDLRDFTHLGSSHKTAADVAECLRSTVNLVRTKYLDIAKFVTLFEPTPELLCYPTQLNQVFMNLIINACDAIRDKQRRPDCEQTSKTLGEIVIACGVAEQMIEISVKDNGCGMDEETQNRLFEPFYTTKDVGEGTGLGMSISFGIVKEHGGTIDIESVAGQGSTIFVRLPVTDED